MKHNKHKSEAIRKLLTQPPPEDGGELGVMDDEPEDSSVLAGDVSRLFRPRSRG